MSRTLTIFLFTLSAALAQQRAFHVRGAATDSSGAPVRGAEITLYSRDGSVTYSAISDAQGAFDIEVPFGDYLVRSGTPGLTLEKQDTIHLERVYSSVVVTATGTAQSVDETAKGVSTVSRDEIDRRGVEFVADAVRETPGLRITQRGGPGGFTTIQTRGLRSFDTSFLVDGMRFRDVGATQADASSFISDLMIADTGRIEVLRGAGSSLYGTNAMSGVVNIVTDEGVGPFHGSVTADGGGLGESRALARLGGEAFGNKLHYSAGGGHMDVTRGVDGFGRYRNTTGNALADYALRPNIRLTARLLATNAWGELYQSPAAGKNLPATGWIPASTATFTPAQGDPDYSRTAQFVSSLIAIEHQVSAPFTYRLSYQALLSNREVVNGPQGTGFQPSYRTSDQYNGRIDTIQARASYVAGTHQLLTAGYEYEREYFDQPSTDTNPTPALRVNSRITVSEGSHSFDAQDQIRLLHDRLNVSLSGHFQKFDLSAPVFAGTVPVYSGVSAVNPPNAWTGDASIAYLLTKTGTKLRSHVGNSYRKPSLYELFGASFFGGTYSAYGDPRLNPERSISVDAGADQYLASGRVRLSATYFYTRLQEVIAFDFSGLITPSTDFFGRSSGYFNTHGGLSRGAELSAEARPWRSTRVQASYTYTNARDKVSQFSDGTLWTPRISPHTFGLVVLQQIGKRVDAAFDFTAASDFLYPLSRKPFLFPGTRLAGFSAGYTHPFGERASLRVYTRINNLFDQTYYEDAFRTPGRWATAGVSFAF